MCSASLKKKEEKREGFGVVEFRPRGTFGKPFFGGKGFPFPSTRGNSHLASSLGDFDPHNFPRPMEM